MMKYKSDPNNNPLTPLYRKMDEEIPTNSVERHILKMLEEGKAVSECRDYMVENGFTKEEFDRFFERLRNYENENCSSWC